ncbi:GNAT family N-acetyltransferase [Enterovirga aerilata]|uniref:N-acetyltransferase n=1 Tax=Enterovirga aerilata TaxID=2730920 RepID=A0A849I6R1_9HYPH|nr:GNAT family N-acetyltransferase [Enterovirga sp. DB1703]NNM72005.1 N-acetyltransferase [Enterovirga sp. DB1703]
MDEEPGFRDAAERRRFELDVGGETVFADYRREPGTLVIRYVFAPPALRGTGAADRLMSAVAARARQEGARIVATCHYAHSWLRSHKAHRDLLAN